MDIKLFVVILKDLIYLKEKIDCEEKSLFRLKIRFRPELNVDATNFMRVNAKAF